MKATYLISIKRLEWMDGRERVRALQAYLHMMPKQQ
jgi:hypothetical protein